MVRMEGETVGVGVVGVDGGGHDSRLSALLPPLPSFALYQKAAHCKKPPLSSPSPLFSLPSPTTPHHRYPANLQPPPLSHTTCSSSALFHIPRTQLPSAAQGDSNETQSILCSPFQFICQEWNSFKTFSVFQYFKKILVLAPVSSSDIHMYLYSLCYFLKTAQQYNKSVIVTGVYTVQREEKGEGGKLP